jgi:hypothetical protein
MSERTSETTNADRFMTKLFAVTQLFLGAECVAVTTGINRWQDMVLLLMATVLFYRGVRNVVKGRSMEPVEQEKETCER